MICAEKAASLLCKSAVPGQEQRAFKRLGECDVARVVGGEVVPQIPDAIYQRHRGVFDKATRRYALDGCLCVIVGDLARSCQQPERLDAFKPNKVRNVEQVAAIVPDRLLDEPHGIGPVERELDEHRRIYDDQWLSRSRRTISATRGPV